jgi:hypothetical protein
MALETRLMLSGDAWMGMVEKRAVAVAYLKSAATMY